MKRSSELSFDEFDELHSPGPAITEIETIIDRELNRRQIMAGGFGLWCCWFDFSWFAASPCPPR